MKMLVLLNESIALNNLGATLLSAGDLQGALDHVMAAAKLLHPVSKQIGMHAGRHPCCPADDTSCSSFPESPAAIRQDVHESADPIRFHGKCLSSAEDTFACLQPIHIPLATRLPDKCTLESAIIVFNMAIVYHLQASASSLHRAAFLYDTAFDLVSALGQHHTTAATVAMASLNNMGVIMWAMGEYAGSRQYLLGLRYFVHKLPLVTNLASLEERRQFLLNTVFLRPPTRAGAA